MAKIILVGKGASGKDTIKKILIERGFRHEISYTSRPPRSTEKDGVDYHFVSEKVFKKYIDSEAFYQYDSFNGWLYGTSNLEWITKNLFIITPEGVSKIMPYDRKSCLILYIDTPLHIRMKRLMARNDADKVQRRIDADEAQFKNFTDYDIRICHGDENPINVDLFKHMI